MTRDRAAVLDRVERELPPDRDALRRLEARRDRRAMRRRVAGGAVGVTITTAIVVLGASLTRPETFDPPVPGVTPRSSVLPIAAPGEYYYVRLSTGSTGTTNERWFAHDGSGRFTTSIDGVVVDDRSFEKGELTGKLYSDLPEDARGLIAELRDRSAPNGASPVSIPTPAPPPDEEETILLAMSDLLGYASDYLVPGQIAGVFRAASTMPGVLVDAGVDSLGREAITLSWNYRDDDSEILVRWFFEPTTHQYMGEQRFDSSTGGGLLSQEFVELAGIVSSTHERPPPSARYVPMARSGAVEDSVSAGTPAASP